MILLASQVVVTIALSTIERPPGRGIRGTLTLESRQKRGTGAHIKGAFHSEDGDGIRFETSQEKLVVTTMDGKVLIYTRKIPVTVQSYGEDAYSTVYQILDDAYMESNEALYHVAVTDAISRDSAAFTHSQLLESVEAEPVADVQTAVKASLGRLVAQPAVRLLESAARSLGEDMEVTGSDEPASMLFYAAAMSLSGMYEESVGRSAQSEPSDAWLDFFGAPATAQKYPDCNMNSCPPCKEDECVGMCGRICSCWWWVCGNCCEWNGCLQHDLCCISKGFASFKCLFPVGFSCSSYRC